MLNYCKVKVCFAGEPHLHKHPLVQWQDTPPTGLQLDFMVISREKGTKKSNALERISHPCHLARVSGEVS